MNDAISRFRDAIRSTGLEPPDVIEPGRLHRFPGAGKGPSNRAGWCKLFDDGLGGCFGDWSSGLSCTWFSKRDWPSSPQAQSALSRQIKAARWQAELSRRDRHAEAASRARKFWDAAPAAPRHHTYLVTKGIEPHNARLHNGCLVLPVTSFEDSISSLQFIAPNGGKRLLSGGRKRGCFIAVAGDEEHAQRVIICEGWATGCTLAEDDPDALVLAAIDAGNLQPVAVAARRRWPSGELVIAGDDDRLTPGNPGATKAREAAIAADALLALPQWPEGTPEHLTDFNDLALWLAGGGA
ncbi:MAG: topoisomerase [Spiribacter salinus]|uniref:Topoisomerase n=1 Tax=Spiribacter salinus TaxID=1335746 RepID=A0A540VS77_9GAMM|nr:MAG: topoisomerase [Spiribacter salinus]